MKENTQYNIYAVIIGSEILNRRRDDQHFEYLSNALAKVGHTLFASFVIKDDKELITQVYELVKKDENALMFSFGGIGSTPDDLTRALSANVFADKKLYRHPKFEQDIIERLGEKAYPYPILMSDLPKKAKLLHNPINNMSGYYLQNRYFFMPGFPEMAQPMIDEIIAKFISLAPKKYTHSLLAQCGENRLTHLMLNMPKEIELSSLPMMATKEKNNPSVELSLSSSDKELVQQEFKVVSDFLEAEAIEFEVLS